MFRFISGCFAIVLLTVTLAYAGTTGNIAGTVRDADSGEPLEGATVSLQGTSVGTFCDAKGKFQLFNIPAGEYTLIASLIGFRQVTVENVDVIPDFTKQINIALPSEAIEMGEVVISGERELIQRDETSTVRVTTSEELKTMPVRTAQEVVSLQASVVYDRGRNAHKGGRQATGQGENSLFIRGGRSGEVAFIVDGVNQQDPISGQTTTSVNNNAIEQVVLTTGGFNAEYGKIMSGVVNVTTKGGGKEYSGTAEVVTDAIAGDWVGANSYEQNIYSLSFGGPLIPKNDRIRFFVSGEVRDFGDRNPRNALSEPFYTVVENGQEVRKYEDGKIPHQSLEGYSMQGKLSMDISPVMTLELSGLGSENDYEEYYHTYKYNMNHSPAVEEDNMSLSAKFRHTLDAKTFYTFTGSYFNSDRFRGDGEHMRNLRDYARVHGNPNYEQHYALFWNSDIDTTPIDHDEFGNIVGDEGTVYARYEDRRTSYIGFKADMVTQRFDNNEIKAGFEFQRYTLRRMLDLDPEKTFIVGVDENGNYEWNRTTYREDDGLFTFMNSYGIALDENALKEGKVEFVDVDDGQNGAKHPIAFGAYLQDKFEYEGIIVNFGLRLDYLNANTDALKDEDNPTGGDATIDEEDLEDSKAYYKLSPRLGISFPITNRMFFRFSYGKFFQQPQLQNLYINYDYLDYYLEAGGPYTLFGNPNLEPEETTAYEIGLTRQIGTNLRFDITAYYKNTTNLVQSVLRTGPNLKRALTTFQNTDYGTVRGFEFALKLRRTNHVTADLAYTLAYAQGTGSNPETRYYITWQFQEGDEPPKVTQPLDFDQRHSFKLTTDIRYGEDEGPEIGGVQVLENLGVNTVMTMASGLPYTPAEVRDERYLGSGGAIATPTGPVNSGRRPWTFNIDMKITRDFSLPKGMFQAYLLIENVLDRRNVVGVYQSSGDPETTTYLSTPEGQAQVEQLGQDYVDTYHEAERTSGYYDKPRMVKLGLSYQF